MSQGAEIYPASEETALFVRQAALYEREIQENPHDVIRQARASFENGKLHALNGHHERALDLFYAARSWFAADRQAAREETLKEITVCIAACLGHVGLASTFEPPAVPRETLKVVK